MSPFDFKTIFNDNRSIKRYNERHAYAMECCETLMTTETFELVWEAVGEIVEYEIYAKPDVLHLYKEYRGMCLLLKEIFNKHPEWSNMEHWRITKNYLNQF